MCSSRACHPRQGGMTLDDREPSWITDRPLAGSRCLSEWPPTTSHATSNVSRKKKKSRHNGDTDKTKTQTKWKQRPLLPFALAHHGVFQPFVASRRPRALTLREHWRSLTWQLRLFKRSRLRAGTARRWGTTWRLWFHNRDGAFVSECSLVPLQGVTVSSEQACFHDTGCLAHSEP